MNKEFQKIVNLRKIGGYVAVDTPLDFTEEDMQRAAFHVDQKTPEYWDMMANEGHLSGNVPQRVLIACMIDYLP